jgi:hypothetical protein
MSRWLLVVCVLGSSAWLGCSGGSPPPPDTSAAAPAASPAVAQEPAPVQVAAEATPDQVVSVFLNALRVGDKATTASLLTAKAREETAKHNIAVDPQSAPNAQYQVHKAEFLADTPSGSHVTSVWNEKYADGEVTYNIVWVLRKQTEGWRIAGMALELTPGEQPAFLNFEDPLDMMRKRDEAIAAQQPPAAEVAQQPAGVSGTPQYGVEAPGLTAQPSQAPVDFGSSPGISATPSQSIER